MSGFFPSLAAVLTRFITREGFRDHMLHFRFKGHIKHYLLAWLGPGVLVILGAESPDLRGQAGEILLRWAQDYYAGHPFRES